MILSIITNLATGNFSTNAIAGINGLTASINNFKLAQDALTLSTQGVSAAQAEQTLMAKYNNEEAVKAAMANYSYAASNEVVAASEAEVTVGELVSILAQEKGSNIEARRTLLKAGLIKAINEENAAVKKLTISELEQLVVQEKLTEQEKELLISTLGLQKGTGSVSGLGKAFSGLASAIGISTTALGIFLGVAAGIAAVAIAVKVYREHMKKLVETANEAGNAWEDQNSSLDENIEKIKELRETLDSATLSEEEAYQAKSDLLSIQNQLKESYGEQVEGINLVNGSLETQLGLLQAITQEEANKLINENYQGYKEAERQMTKSRHYTLSEFAYLSDDDKEILDKYAENVEYTKNATSGTYTIKFTGDASEAEEIINALQTDLNNSGSVLAQIMANTVSNVLQKNQDILDTYQDTYNQYLSAEMYKQGTGEGTPAKLLNDYATAVENYNEALLQGDESAINEAAEAFENVNNQVEAFLADGSNAQFATFFEDVENQLATSTIAMNDFTDAVKKDEDKWKAAFDGMDDIDLQALYLTVDDENFDAAEKVKEAYDDFKDIQKEVLDKNVDLTQTVYGNIDTNNRQILEWNRDNIEQYRQELASWRISPEDILGSSSTILGASLEVEGLEFAVSPMLQTEDGAVLLDENTVNEYLNRLIETACEDDGNWTFDEIFSLDAEGLEIDGQKINNIIADIGETAQHTAEAMHYVGEDGAVNDAYNRLMTELENAGMDLAEAINIVGTGSATSELKDLIEIGKEVGLIADDSADSIKILTDALVELGIITGEVTSETPETPFDYSELTSALATFSENMGTVSDAYDELKEKGFVTAETLASVGEIFGGLDGYDAFEQIVSNIDMASKEGQQAFNDLVTEYINSTDMMKYLANATDEQIRQIIDNFTELGITNAEERVTAAAEEASRKAAIDAQYLAGAAQEYLNYCLNKTGYTEAFINSTNSLNGQMIAALGESYKADYDNWCNLISQKAAAYNQFVSGLNSSMGNGLTYHDSVGADAQAQRAYDDMQSAVKSLTIDYKPISTNYGKGYTYSGGSGSSSSGSSGSNSSSDPEEFDWIETKLSRIQRTISNLGKTVSATYKTWSARNTALSSELSNINKEISLQQQAYDYYMKKANSVGLSSKYKTLVQNGAIKIEDISDESLADKINSYMDYYEKALDCLDNIQDLEADLADGYMTKFDNIASEYDNKLSVIEHEINMLEGTIDQVEESGHIVNASYYKSLIEQENSYISALQNEYTALTKARDSAVSSGAIAKYSQDWYDMTSDIADVTEEIQDATTELIKFNNELRQLAWDAFDLEQEMLSGVADEADFLIDLMSNDKLVDDKGNFTDEGTATIGLHAVKYNTYMSQADDYAKELKEIEEDLADDPYNTDLLDRKQELIEASRDMVLAAEDEKQAIKDMYSDAYDAMLDYLQEMIDKRKELLDQTKDLYDYEKNIKDLTSEVTSYQKQLAAYSGDNSEESRAHIQQLKVSLEEAQENLEEAEYEQYLEDQEKMLDALADEAEQWVNERLDNLDELLSKAFETTNSEAAKIGETLENKVGGVGTALSEEMSTIWKEGAANEVVSAYGNDFSTKLTTVNTVLAQIRDHVAKIAGISDESDTSGSGSDTGSGSGNSANSNSSSSSSSSSTSSSSSSSSSGKWGSWFISKKNSYTKSKLNKDTSIVDRLKYFDYDSSSSARAKYYAAMGGTDKYTGSSKQNRWMIAQMKANGFKQGGTIGSAIKRTGEDGFVLARTGEEILSLEKIQELGNVFSSMNPILDYVDSIASLSTEIQSCIPKATLGCNNTVSLEIGDIQMYGVNNPEEFASQLRHALKYDNLTKKIIDAEIIGKLTKQPTVSKYKY